MANENPKADLLVSEEMLNTYHNEGVLPVKDSVTVTRDLIKSTVGWTGKNLFKYDVPSYEHRTVTYTINPDKSILVNGSPSTGFSVYELIKSTDNFWLPAGTYIFSRGSDTDAHTAIWLRKWDGSKATNISILSTQEDDRFTLSEDTWVTSHITVDEGATADNVLIYPMLRKATDTDSTYEPYHEDVVDTLRDAEVIEGKNLVENKIFAQDLPNTVKITCNSDGTISLSGTSTGSSVANLNELTGKELKALGNSLVISGGVTSDVWLALRTINYSYVKKSTGKNVGVVINTSELTDDTTYYLTVGIENVTISTNGMVIYPMICTKDEWDKSHKYEPYYPNINNFSHTALGLEETGAVNLLPNIITTQTVSGVTLTKYDDGTVKLNGTATARVNFVIASKANLTHLLKYIGKRVYLTGVPHGYGGNIWISFQGLAVDGYGLMCYDSRPEDSTVIKDFSSFSGVQCYIAVTANTTVNNLIIKPMLSLISGAEYQPYAMTNRELTDLSIVKYVTSNITKNTTYISSNSTLYAEKYGKVVVVKGWINVISVPTTSNKLVFATGFPAAIREYAFPAFKTTSDGDVAVTGTIKSFGIHPNGEFVVYTPSSARWETGYYLINATYICS